LSYKYKFYKFTYMRTHLLSTLWSDYYSSRCAANYYLYFR